VGVKRTNYYYAASEINLFLSSRFAVAKSKIFRETKRNFTTMTGGSNIMFEGQGKHQRTNET
jgi:hypothetical protein